MSQLTNKEAFAPGQAQGLPLIPCLQQRRNLFRGHDTCDRVWSTEAGRQVWQQGGRVGRPRRKMRRKYSYLLFFFDGRRLMVDASWRFPAVSDMPATRRPR